MGKLKYRELNLPKYKQPIGGRAGQSSARAPAVNYYSEIRFLSYFLDKEYEA